MLLASLDNLEAKRILLVVAAFSTATNRFVSFPLHSRPRVALVDELTACCIQQYSFESAIQPVCFEGVNYTQPVDARAQ